MEEKYAGEDERNSTVCTIKTISFEINLLGTRYVILFDHIQRPQISIQA